MQPSNRERLLTPREASAFLRVSESWLAKARMRGDGPPYARTGPLYSVPRRRPAAVDERAPPLVDQRAIGRRPVDIRRCGSNNRHLVMSINGACKLNARAINAAFPLTVIQTCIVHLIRHSLEFVSWKDRKLVVPALKAIYRAKNEVA